MTVYRGAQHDLATRVNTHLFLLCPNNCGSTFLIQALGLCQAAWSLPREGQHVPGYVGPRSRGSEFPLTWAASEERVATYTDPTRYNWERTRRAWYFQAISRSDQANVLVSKSPPHLLIPELLVENFRNVKFLIMVRNPYAMVEGILRRNRTDPHMPTEAAQHTVRCLRIQADNIRKFAARSAFLTYEGMCADPVGGRETIVKLMPELADVELDQRIPVKGMYDSRLRNFNEEQINRLSARQIDRINAVFGAEMDLLSRFGYALRGHDP